MPKLPNINKQRVNGKTVSLAFVRKLIQCSYSKEQLVLSPAWEVFGFLEKQEKTSYFLKFYQNPLRFEALNVFTHSRVFNRKGV